MSAAAIEGQVAIVTGASQGIGREIALELADLGANLVLTSRTESKLQAVAAEVRERGREALVVVADVAAREGPPRVFDAALSQFERVDILINNAGKGHAKPLLELTEEDWQESFALNFWSAVRLSTACIPHMKERGSGRIVNISSRVGRQPDPYFAAYAASKAALINFSKNLANAFSKHGVLTNCVVPGLIRSEAVQQAAEASAAATGKSVDEVYAATLAKRPIPAGRIGEPQDVAGLVGFLCTQRASWITGGTFMVDGGILPTAP